MFWIPAYFWLLLWPESFVDDEGYVLPGWPSVIARTRDMIAMLWWSYKPFMSNPAGENLKLEANDILWMLLITWCDYLLSRCSNTAFLGIPAAA